MDDRNKDNRNVKCNITVLDKRIHLTNGTRERKKSSRLWHKIVEYKDPGTFHEPRITHEVFKKEATHFLVVMYPFFTLKIYLLVQDFFLSETLRSLCT